MTMFGSQWLANAGASYEIEQSIRFNDDDSARLARTVSSSGSLTTWTLSGWIKRGKYTVNTNGQWFPVFSASAGSTTYDAPLNFNDVSTGGAFNVTIGGYNWRTSALARDTSAWYHVVIVWDSTNGTASDRMRLYINGERVTAFSSSASPSSGANSRWNSSSYSHHRIGNLNYNGGETTYVFDGYLSEINFIDGTALDPTSFGEYNADGVWIPKAYSGSYGTNGFYVTGATAADLGEDFSGNNNDFTSSGLATTDQMLDTPTLNYPTLNPDVLYQAGLLLSDGNLDAFGSSGSNWNLIPATMQIPSTGKWAFECTILSSTGYIMIGFASAEDINNFQGTGKYFSLMQNAGWLYNVETNKRVNGSGTNSGGLAGLTTNDVVECMIDNDAGTMTFLKNGSAYASLSGLNPLTQPAITVYTNGVYRAKVDFGQIDYVPSDASYSAINSSTLPTPSITDGSAYFQPTLYTGTGSSQAVSQSGNSTFQPDWAWIKGRSGATEHVLTDAVRGVTKELSSNDNGAEETVAQGLTTFGSSGFTVGTDGSYNTSSATYVGWQWKANGSGSSNEDGSITSTVSANTTAGFSIVKFVGNATSGATVGHGLGVVPKMLTVKDLSVGGSWAVYHAAVGATKYMNLDTTAAAATTTNRWNDTEPTSSVFSLGNENEVNASGRSYVAYCFAEIPGYSSFGSYTGNGSADGTFIYTGFKPAYVLMKKTSAVDYWIVYDSARDPDNFVNKRIYVNTSGAEDPHASNDHVDFVSNGFKQRSAGTRLNASGGSYIYIAFAENPFGGDGVAPATAR